MDKLVRMANQIADFFAPMPEAEGVRGAATHLKKFWTPKMIGELKEYERSGEARLQPLARAALLSLGEESSN